MFVSCVLPSEMLTVLKTRQIVTLQVTLKVVIEADREEENKKSAKSRPLFGTSLSEQLCRGLLQWPVYQTFPLLVAIRSLFLIVVFSLGM